MTTKEKKSLLCKELRLALTGQKHGMDIFKIMELLGKEKTLKRIHEYLENYETSNVTTIPERL